MKHLPRDFLDELAVELETSREELVRQAERLSVLAELQRAANTATSRLGRPATVYDVIATAHEGAERERLLELAKLLREG
jgi:predicted ArsR family transcriptional regulator